MTSPHSGYPHQGPSYYPQSPPSHHVYGNHSPGPGHSPNPYQYMYPSHPPPPHMNSHHSPIHHQPTSGRMNGRGGSYQNRNGHGHPHMYHQNFHPPQHQSYPLPLALHAPHPQHPPHPAKFAHPYTPPYPYPSPTSAGPYSPSWQPQQPLSPLPKQLSMPPPRGISPAYYEPPPVPPLHPTVAVASDSYVEPVNETISSPTQEQESIAVQAEQVPEVPEASALPKEPAADDVGEPSVTQVPEPLVASESSSSSTQTPSTYTTMGSITNNTIPDSNVPLSPTQSISSTKSQKSSAPNPIPSFAIWSRRPEDPSRAPGIIISPRARPPSEILQQALDLKTPQISPKPISISLPEQITEGSVSAGSERISGEYITSPVHDKDISGSSVVEPSQINSTISSSSVTETDVPTLPGSPLSTNTSISVTCTPSKDTTATTALLVEEKLPEVTADAHAVSDIATPVASTSKTPEPEHKPAPKSWASLFTSSSSANSSLPTSSVVGFSIPAASSIPAVPVAPSKKAELLNLLTSGPSPSLNVLPKIRTRGLINSGNMCFANAVLQVLVYCQPFQRFFTELGKLLGKGMEKKSETKSGKSNTPFVDATVEFLKEFVEEGRKKEGLEKKAGKGKEKEVEPEGGDELPESFLPSYVYDAMKEKKRFENMRGGQQEDAEEFLGFYLDTLEEELLYLQNSLAPPSKSAATAAAKMVEEREEAEPPEEDGWLEVGKRNRTVVTRTIKGAESPITRMFGGKFKSTLKAPGQKDSVLVEDWRSLRLDIQRETIHNIQDALLHITHPQPVQVTHSSRPGVTVDASQKVLIDLLPPVLVLHMKRFCYDTTVGGVVKVTNQVQFGPELEIGFDMMAPTGKRKQPIKYKLFGALYHHGHSASGGHYTLDVLHHNRYPGAKLKEGWVRVDDELVSDVQPEDVFNAWEKDETRNAYLLFYKRIR